MRPTLTNVCGCGCGTFPIHSIHVLVWFIYLHFAQNQQKVGKYTIQYREGMGQNPVTPPEKMSTLDPPKRTDHTPNLRRYSTGCLRQDLGTFLPFWSRNIWVDFNGESGHPMVLKVRGSLILDLLKLIYYDLYPWDSSPLGSPPFGRGLNFFKNSAS